MPPTKLELPSSVIDCRARLEQEPLDADAVSRLRDALGPTPHTPPLAVLADLCCVLDGGQWHLPGLAFPPSEPLTTETHETLVRHPSEKKESGHRLASLFGRALYMWEGNLVAKVIRKATEPASAHFFPRLTRIWTESARWVAINEPAIHVGRGADPAFHILVDGMPFLYVHQSWVGEGPPLEGERGREPLTDAELRFALARQLMHLKGGHATLLQLSGEDMEQLVLDQLPLLVTIPLKASSKVVGWTRLNRAVRSVGNWFRKSGRTQQALHGVGAILPDKEQETILPEIALDWLRGWIQVLEFTADRAGLLYSGSVAASCTSLLKLLPAHESELPEIQQRGLRWFLQHHPGANSTRARLRELLRFALSWPYLRFLASNGQTER